MQKKQMTVKRLFDLFDKSYAPTHVSVKRWGTWFDSTISSVVRDELYCQVEGHVPWGHIIRRPTSLQRIMEDQKLT
jgi:hypothetical protein